MKKILSLLIGCIAITSLLMGCTASKSAIETQKTQSTEAVTQPPKTLTSVKIVEHKLENPKGDRTADNVAQENGEYFAIGSDVVKCSEYDNIHMIVELKNNRDTILNTSAAAWSAKMEDGYELELFQNGVGVGVMNDGSLGKQIQSGSAETFEFDILKEKKVKGDKIILTYWDMDFGTTYTEFMKDAISGVSEEECKKKYPEFFDKNLYYNIDVILK